MIKHPISRISGRMLAGFVTAALLFTGMVTDVHAETTGSVAVNSAIVRADASTTADSVCTASSGTEVTVTDQKTDSSGNTWYHVTMSDGSEGYIRSDLLTVDESAVSADQTDDAADTAAADENADASSSGNVVNGIDVASITVPEDVTAQDFQQATVDVDAGKVRTDASTDSEIAATLSKGTDLVIAGSKNGSDSKTWYYVSFLNNGTQSYGFIRSDLVSMGDVIVLQTEEPEETDTEEQTEEDNAETAVNNDYELVYTDDGTGTDVWYLYNHIDNTREKLEELLNFADSQTEKQAEDAATIRNMKIVIIILAALLLAVVIALVIVIIRSHSGSGYYEYDDDDEEDDEEEDDEEEDDDEEPSRGRKGIFGRRKYRDDEDDEDEEEDEEPEVRPERSRQRSAENTRRPQTQSSAKQARQPEPSGRRTASDAAPRKPVAYEEELPVKPAAKKTAKSKNFMLDDDFEFEFLKLDDED